MGDSFIKGDDEMAEIERYKIENQEKWRDYIKTIPAIKFNPEWGIKVIPPFGGAFARFIVEFNGKTASIYLDCNDSLGCMGEPYWEVYPVGDDVGRCLMAETDELLSLINESLSRD